MVTAYSAIPIVHAFDEENSRCVCGLEYHSGVRHTPEAQHFLHLDAIRYEWALDYGFIPTSTDEISVYCPKCGAAVNLPDQHIKFHRAFDLVAKASGALDGLP